DGALVGRGEADDEVEGGRFPRAVGTEQSDDLSAGDGDRNAVDDTPAGIRLDEILRAERFREGAHLIFRASGRWIRFCHPPRPSLRRYRTLFGMSKSRLSRR